MERYRAVNGVMTSSKVGEYMLVQDHLELMAKVNGALLREKHQRNLDRYYPKLSMRN